MITCDDAADKQLYSCFESRVPIGQLHGRNIGPSDTSQCVEGVDTSLLCLVQCRLVIIGISRRLDSEIHVFIVLRHQQGIAGHLLFGVMVRRHPSVSTPEFYYFRFADLLDHNIGLGINNGSTGSLVSSISCYKSVSYTHLTLPTNREV